MIDDRFVYVFVRQDMALADQIVQAMHAVYGMVSVRGEWGEPNIVLIGVPDAKALRRVEAKLQDSEFAHYKWTEPDLNIGFTAIATSPLDMQQKQVLSNYRLWRHSPERELAPSVETGNPDARVAQLRERLVANEGVGSGNLPAGANTYSEGFE